MAHDVGTSSGNTDDDRDSGCDDAILPRGTRAVIPSPEGLLRLPVFSKDTAKNKKSRPSLGCSYHSGSPVLDWHLNLGDSHPPLAQQLLPNQHGDECHKHNMTKVTSWEKGVVCCSWNNARSDSSHLTLTSCGIRTTPPSASAPICARSIPTCEAMAVCGRFLPLAASLPATALIA